MHGFNGFLDLPARSPKPRQQGLTHVIDKGIALRQVENLFETAGDYVDIVKLGWGTGYVTQNLKEKIELYRSFEVPVVCGGTLLEAVVARGKLDEYRRWLTENGFSHVEVSDGTIDLPREQKLELVAEFAQDFVVMSEVGSKDSEVVFAPYQWVQWLKEDLEAGAWKVITEGRESGTVGLYRTSGEIRTGLIDEIESQIDPARLLFEAPQKAQQVWLIKHFGPNVNLGNIAPQEVISVETIRQGLRADTMTSTMNGGG